MGGPQATMPRRRHVRQYTPNVPSIGVNTAAEMAADIPRLEGEIAMLTEQRSRALALQSALGEISGDLLETWVEQRAKRAQVQQMP